MYIENVTNQKWFYCVHKKTCLYILVSSLILIFSVRSSGAVCEVKIENNLPLRTHNQWVTIGDENKPWHIHVNIHDTVEARFVKEDKAGSKKVSYSIRFFDVNGGLVLRANFINMYDDAMH